MGICRKIKNAAVHDNTQGEFKHYYATRYFCYVPVGILAAGSSRPNSLPQHERSPLILNSKREQLVNLATSGGA
jgi:hypothetical protein